MLSRARGLVLAFASRFVSELSRIKSRQVALLSIGGNGVDWQLATIHPRSLRPI